jgi:hypothetical protein
MDFNDMADRAERGLRRNRGQLWQQSSAIMFLYGAAISTDSQYWNRGLMITAARNKRFDGLKFMRTSLIR